MKNDHQLLGLLWLCLAAFVVHSARAQPPPAMLIPRNSTWKYHNLNQDLGTAWLALNYDDSANNGWTNGIAPLGDNVEGATQEITVFGGTVIDIGPNGSRFPTIYFRKTFNITNANAYEGLTLRIMRDDEVFVYLNGQFLVTSGCGGNSSSDSPSLPHTSYCCAGSAAVGGAEEYTYWEMHVPTTLLVEGTNVFAVEGKQQAPTSSDFAFDMEVEGVIDLQPPHITDVSPTPWSIVPNLNYIRVTFDSDVTGVDASDLLINNTPATNLMVISPREYTFYFSTPATGSVQVTWASHHGITDTAPLMNPYEAEGWGYTYNPNAFAPGQVIITEFMANNFTGIRDEDGMRSDWIELFNPGAVKANLDGWFLTDQSTNLTEWRFPAVGIPPFSYMLVWASGKDRRDPTRQLHTNFRLHHDGEYLALVDNNTNVVSEFAPAFPPQQPDISYGRDYLDPTVTGYFTTPTPGAQNSTGGPGFMSAPLFSIDSGVYTNNSLTLTLAEPPNGTIRYTTDGTNPTNTSAVYSGPISITGNMTVKVRVYPPGNTNLFPSAVVAKTYVLVDPSLWNFNSNLPLLILDSHSTIPADIPPGGTRANGTFVVFDTIGGRTSLQQPPQLQRPAGLELFGQTAISIWGANAKHPYIIEIQDDIGNDEEHSILGLPADADWRTRPAWDKSLMNDFLALELFEQMGHYSVRRRFVEVFVHQGPGKLTASDYSGIEVLFEKIEIAGNRTDLKRMTSSMTSEPDISGGYIFKKDKDSNGDLNFSTAGFNGVSGQNLKFHDPRPPELIGTVAGTNQQRYLVSFLNQMEKSLYANNWLSATGTNHYSYYMDVDAFVDQFWIVEFPKAIDGYRLSAFFSKDRNGKVTPVPIWDWKLAWGNANYLDAGHYANWYWNETGSTDYPWAKRLITGSAASQTGIGDADFCQRIADRWAVLRTNILSGPRVTARIDELAALLTEAATRPAPLGDFTKPAFARLGIYQWPEPNGAQGGWDVDYQNPTTWPAIISEVKKWVNGRYKWIDSLFLPQPTFSQAGGQVTNGTTIALSVTPGATNYYTLDGTDPRAPAGNLAPGALVYSGPIIVNSNVRIFARSRTTNSPTPTTVRPFQNTWSGPAVDTFYSSVSPLRITEIMYHPAGPEAGNTNAADNFEYIEVQNIGGTPLNVNRFSLGGGIQFDFPPVTLDPGQYGVIVANLAAFQSRYGNGILILGAYAGNLGNAGDHIVLSGPLEEPILDFSYDDDWFKATDGADFSLVFLDPTNAPTSSWRLASSWRASAAIGGSPGAADPSPPARPGVVVNEVLSFGDPVPDSIELYNPTASSVNIGGWFLTDDFDNPKKFVIPNTAIPAGQYVTFTTNDFGAGVNGFALSGKGDQVYLFSGDAIDITGYAHGFSFGAAESGVSFGRYLTSTLEEHFVAQKANTLGGTNAGPLVGPLVISEIMYHPPDTLLGTNGTDNNIDEFIELQNITMSPLALYDATRPTNTWHLRVGVDFDFPPNVTIGATGFVLVVSFDPLAYPATLDGFRQRNLVPASVPVYGPWRGQLQNDGGTIELLKPRSNDASAETSYVLVERVQYKDAAPWPPAADGLGLSLQRLVLSSYGNEPTNWAAAAPTSGRANVFGGTVPAVTSQPADQFINAGNDATFTVSATGTGPLRYQWTYYGRNLPGATNTSLVITNFQTNYAGIYNVRVFNSAGYGQGTNFTVTSRLGLRITGQPQDRTVVVTGITGIIGPTTNFTVSALGSGLLLYQWYYNGAAMVSSNNPTVTNATLTLTNIQFGNAGTYYATVRDDYDNMSTTTANLAVMAPPAISFQPISVTIPEGGTATFTISAVGSRPMSFRWRTNGTTFTNAILFNGGNYAMMTITNTPLSYSNTLVTAVITNVAGSSPVSSNARLIVLPDSDHDGLPDSWEDSHAGFNKNDPADGARDDDHDGMSNAAEYIAGTDYLDPNSYLKIQFAGTSGNVLQFTAVTNRTYTVQYSDDLSSPNWYKLSDVVQRNLTRTETIPDPGPKTNRFYRLVIPIQR